MRRELSLALLTVALITAVMLPAGAAGEPLPRVSGGEAVPEVSAGEPVPQVGGGEPVPQVGGAWPVGVRPPVVRGWEPPATEYGRGHRGVDLAAPPGAVVRAVAPGRVSFAGRVAGRGVIAVELAGTGDPPLRTTYEPVRATADVKKGAEVTTGEALGVLELPTAHCPSSCLHWGLLRADAYLNPLSLLPPWLLRGGASRLLPVIDVPLPRLFAMGVGGPQGGARGRDAPLPGADERGLSPAHPAAPW
ncbi:peptidoglycan DD-metalloendopeptidase family protein [Streptomyces rectiviolaceus]